MAAASGYSLSQVCAGGEWVALLLPLLRRRRLIITFFPPPFRRHSLYSFLSILRFITSSFVLLFIVVSPFTRAWGARAPPARRFRYSF